VARARASWLTPRKAQRLRGTPGWGGLRSLTGFRWSAGGLASYPNAMVAWAWVASGGALGAVARFALAEAMGSAREGAFPWATLFVNVLGCAAIGALLGLGEVRHWLSETSRWFLVSGFLGSFTTFSTFGHETASMVHRGHMTMAVVYVSTSLGLSLIAVLLGVMAVRWLA